MQFDLIHNLGPRRTARDLATAIERAVESGALRPGERLPAIRSLARHLGVNPATVSAAYGILSSRGLVHGDFRRGTRVNGRSILMAAAPLPPGVRDLASGSPDTRLLPDLRAALRHVGVPPRLYGSAPKSLALIEAVREDFARSGVAPRFLAVVGGAIDGIERVFNAHLRTGDRVALEDPCFSRILDLARAMALVPEPVELDDRGPIPSSLSRALRRGARALVVTPRAQNPFGAALDEPRAAELRAVLTDHPAVLIIEDDHANLVTDCPGATLVGDWAGPWAVMRSYSKALGPDLRLAVVAGDETTITRVERRQMLGTGWVSHILQDTASWLLTQPSTLGVVRRAAETYAARRKALLAALAAHGITAHGGSGMNVWVPVPREDAVTRQLLEAGWAVQAGENFRLNAAPAIRVTTATLLPEPAAAFAADLAGILRPARTATRFA